ncbi:MAG: hypothetical protein ACI9G1_001620, partial [Pirellulaceae bacterium]
MNDDAIVTNGHLWVADQFVAIVLGRREVNVIGLPRQWWKA